MCQVALEDPSDFVVKLKVHEDSRGKLYEVLRLLDQSIPAGGQIYVFTINPGERRGDHYHNFKREWFTCVSGCADVCLTTNDSRNFLIKISSDEPELIYVPEGTAHALVNASDQPAIILAYGSTQHNDLDPDTYKKIACEGLSTV